MAKTVIDGGRVEEKKREQSSVRFDTLQLYFGEPYTVDVESAEGTITLVQPSLGDVIQIGEEKFYQSLNPFVTNTTTYKSVLWDIGIDWNDISDFDLFKTLYTSVDSDVSALLLSGLDINKFKLVKKDGESTVLYDEEDNIEINEEVYQYLSQYYRTCFQIFPEEKKTSDEMLKRAYIQKDKSRAQNDAGKKDNSSIQSIISACVNHPGFKYKLSELKEIHIYEFYDSVKRLQIYESSTALMKGMYSGMVDSSKINQEDYNFMREI